MIAFLGLTIPPNALVSAYGANSSHGARSNTRKLSRMDLIWVRVGNTVGRLLPLGLLTRIEERRRALKKLSWPDWVWTKTGYRPPRSL